VVNETLAQLSNHLIYSAIAAYAVAMVAFAAEVAFGSRARAADAVPVQEVAATATAPASYPWPGVDPVPVAASPLTPTPSRSDRLGRIAVALTVLAFLLHLASVVARGISAGRPPWGNMYEFATAAALAVTAAYLLLLRRFSIRFLGVVVVPLVLATLGLAVTVLYTESAQLVPALKSYWLVIHVTSAIISFGGFTVALALSLLFLVKDRAERRGRVGGWLERFPDSRRLDRLAYRVTTFVFPLWTFAIVAGAIWAENAWGRYWGWDPKETWAFITWVVYACYLHARATAGWRGRRATYLALLGYACLMFNFFGVNIWITGLHSYAGVG
jgi:cytochrome c-type biogenesis protein CcsB